MENEHGIFLKYNVPNISIVEKVEASSHDISVSLIVNDFVGFINSIKEIREGGSRNFIRYDDKGRKVAISIVNLDPQNTKRMV